MGHLIPAGTGIEAFRKVRVKGPELELPAELEEDAEKEEEKVLEE